MTEININRRRNKYKCKSGNNQETNCFENATTVNTHKENSRSVHFEDKYSFRALAANSTCKTSRFTARSFHLRFEFATAEKVTKEQPKSAAPLGTKRESLKILSEAVAFL